MSYICVRWEGYWSLIYDDGKYDGYEKTVKVEKRLKRVRVQLDFNNRKVLFYHVVNETHICTYFDTFFFLAPDAVILW